MYFRMFRLIFLFLCLSINYSSTSQIIVEKSCTQQKKYPTLIPQTYTAYHLTTYITVEYVFCWYFPSFSCPRKIENTKTISSLRTRLIESTVTRTISICCPGYEEVPDRENYCTPVCAEECENGGICYKPNECICKPQYTGVTCGEDVDECTSTGICEHNCTNFFGYHQCTCHDGFYLDTDGASCNEYSLQINSFQATLKSADSVSLDWQLESDPYLQEISELIESISIDRISETSSLLHLPPETRSALLFNLLPNVNYTYELSIRTIHGDSITSRISVATPPDGIECPAYYNTHYTNPCREGSVCRDTTDNLNYTCECLPGYSEPDCDNINECSDDPCHNGAVCVDGINEYTCICSSQRFTGENCEIQRSHCDLDESPCNGHGTCVSGSADYTCDCEVGYRGLRCEEEIDFCSSSPCLNGGSCMNDADKAVCECTQNYNGDLCELIINPCIGYSCNEGRCFVTQDRQPVCNCTDHLTGDRCSITCQDDNGDLCVCDTNTQDGACRGYCLEDRDNFYNISWTQTISGSTVNVACSLISSTLTGLVSRSCLSTSRWSDVNITECTDIPVTNTTDTFTNCTTARDVANDLLTYTKQIHSSYSDSTNVDAVFTILNELSIYSNQRACSKDLDKAIIEILSGLLTVSFFSGLEIDNQAKFRASLRTIEETILQLSPTEDVTLSETGVSTFLTNNTDIDYLRVRLPILTETRKYEIEFVSGEFSDVSVSIPSQILEDRGVTPHLDVFILKSSEVFNSVNTTIKNERELISQIISLNIRNKNQQFVELQEPIQISFEIKEKDLESVSCVYLNKLGEWSTGGVRLDTISSNIKVTCNVFHLSMFAVMRQVKTTETSIVPTALATHVNTTQLTDFSTINLITLISSILITGLISVYLVILCVTRFYTDTKGIGDKLNTVCMINTSSAHLLISLLIGLTVIIQLIQLSEPIICFASRAITQYSYLVLVNSMITELIIGLVYVKFADKDGNLRKVNLILTVSLFLCWATPVIITLFTTIPLYNSISVIESDITLMCAFLSTDETFYIITTYFFVSFAVFTCLSLIAILYMRRTGIRNRKMEFLMKFMPRSILILITQLLLFIIIIPADFLLPNQSKSHIFYLYQLIVIVLLLLLICYLQRGSFKKCFKVKEESKKEVIETAATTISKETNEKRVFFVDNEYKFELGPFPFNSNNPSVADIVSMGDVILSPGPMPGHTRSQSGSGLLEGDSVSGRRSVRTNSHLYQVYEQPDHPRPLYHNEGRNVQSLPRYSIPYTLPTESAAQTDHRIYLEPNLPPRVIGHGLPQRRMTDNTRPKPPRVFNAMSCDLLDSPDVTKRGIPIILVERPRLTKHLSNSLPYIVSDY